MKVKVYCINSATAAQYYGLMSAEDNTPICNAHAWRTENGAIRWAEKNGYKVIK